MKEKLLLIRNQLKMGHRISFAEAMLLQRAIDILVYGAGKSPVIGIDPASGPDRTVEVRYIAPPGYVMVPKEPTEEMNKAGWAAMNEHDAINPTYRAMLAAAQHDTPALNPVQGVLSVQGWIPVSERMPETDGNYWGWWSESKRQGPVWFIKSDLQAQFQSSEITHWMPLPAAPQEVSHG